MANWSAMQSCGPGFFTNTKSVNERSDLTVITYRNGTCLLIRYVYILALWYNLIKNTVEKDEKST